jgi:hypothetical protein
MIIKPKKTAFKGMNEIQLFILSLLLVLNSCNFNTTLSIQDKIDERYVLFNEIKIVIYNNRFIANDRAASPDELKKEHDLMIEANPSIVAGISNLLDLIKKIDGLEKISSANGVDFTIRCDLMSSNKVIYTFSLAELNPEIIWINGEYFKKKSESRDSFPLDVLPYIFLPNRDLYDKVHGSVYN